MARCGAKNIEKNGMRCNPVACCLLLTERDRTEEGGIQTREHGTDSLGKLLKITDDELLNAFEFEDAMPSQCRE